MLTVLRFGDTISDPSCRDALMESVDNMKLGRNLRSKGGGYIHAKNPNSRVWKEKEDVIFFPALRCLDSK